jgi:hypothetical protein
MIVIILPKIIIPEITNKIAKVVYLQKVEMIDD